MNIIRIKNYLLVCILIVVLVDSELSNNGTQIISKIRKKRFLRFEKGSSVLLQGNIAKSIIGPAPRGLNVLTEYTFGYELPEKWTGFRRPKPMSMPKKRIFYPNRKSNFHYSDSYHTLDYRFTSRPSAWYHHHSRRNLNEEPKLEHSLPFKMFMNIITLWAYSNNYVPRYCLLRIVCEAKFILPESGSSLITDILRVFLSYIDEAEKGYRQMEEALLQPNVLMCTQLYGLHCRHSLFQELSQLF